MTTPEQIQAMREAYAAHVAISDAELASPEMEQVFKAMAEDYERAAGGFDLIGHIYRQRDWSRQTFGTQPRTKGVIDHIRKELLEIEAAPADLSEWVDVVILAIDGAWRAGHEPEEIAQAIAEKQAKNERRTWPDYRTLSEDKVIEHVRIESEGANG